MLLLAISLLSAQALNADLPIRIAAHGSISSETKPVKLRNPATLDAEPATEFETRSMASLAPEQHGITTPATVTFHATDLGRIWGIMGPGDVVHLKKGTAGLVESKHVFLQKGRLVVNALAGIYGDDRWPNAHEAGAVLVGNRDNEIVVYSHARADTSPMLREMKDGEHGYVPAWTLMPTQAGYTISDTTKVNPRPVPGHVRIEKNGELSAHPFDSK